MKIYRNSDSIHFSNYFNSALIGLILFLQSMGVSAFSYDVTGPVYLDNSTGSTPLNSGDFNGDGRKDIVITKNGQYTYILRQDQNGVLVESNKVPTWLAFEPANPGDSYVYMLQNLNINVADINNDGKDDIVFTHSYGVTSLVANSENGFDRQEISESYDNGIRLSNSILIDMNDDGRLDLLAQSNSKDLYYWLNTGAGFETQKRFLLQPQTYSISRLAAGDLNSDGLTDFAVISSAQYSDRPSQLQVFLKNPNGEYLEQSLINLPVRTNIQNIAIGDVNNDGRDDIALTNSQNYPSSVLLLFLQTQDGGIADYLAYAADHIPASILIHDMDGDGVNDVVTNHPGWSMVYTYLQKNGVLVYQDPVCCNLANNGDDPQAMAAGDFNSDGCSDIILSAGGGYYFLKGKECVNSVPGAPEITLVRSGDKSINVFFKAPDNNGAQPILGYTAYCGDKTASGLSFSLTVNGLTNGNSYNCTVAARNVSGEGPRSSASASVIPVPSLSVAGLEVMEGNSGARYAIFKAVLSGPAVNSGASFDVHTETQRSNGRSAAANVDYIQIVSNKMTIPSGQSSIDIMVKIIGDRKVEPDEVFIVALSNPAGTVFDLASATGVIKNDDNQTLARIKPPQTPDLNPSAMDDCMMLRNYSEMLENDVVTGKAREKPTIADILQLEKLAFSIGCKANR